MKYFFGFDITDTSREPVYDGNCFAARGLPQSQQRALDDCRTKLETLEKQAKLPLILRILKTVAMFVTMICIVSLLRAEVTLFQAYENAPWVFWSGGIGAVVWALLAFMGYLTGKRVKDTEDYKFALRQVETVRANSLTMLGVPKSAVPVDVLSMHYTVKNGKIKRKTIGIADYANPEMQVFSDEENLYLADVEVCYAIPRASLAGIRKVDKRISVPGWNKPVAFNKGMFREYKLEANKYGQIFMKPYYQLVIRQEGEEMVLEFPPYELPTFRKLTGQREFDGISAM